MFSNVQRRHFIVPVIFIVLVWILQFGVMYWRFSFNYQIQTSQFGFQALTTVFFITILDILSGAILAIIFLTKRQPNLEVRKRETLAAAALLSILPVLALLFKLLFAAYGPDVARLSILGPLRFSIFDWIMTSQVPSFWIGLVIGWLVKQFSLSGLSRPRKMAEVISATPPGR